MTIASRRTGPPLIWILGLLAAFGPMSVDMYLPSLPAIGRDLSATAADVQLTLSAFFVGSAIGQLHDGTAVPMAAVIAVCGLACIFADRLVAGRR